jgi:hypothetical protein
MQPHQAQDPTAFSINAAASLFSEAERQLAQELISDGQSHLFIDWDAPGVCDKEKKEFMATLLNAHRAYPGGLTAYTRNARRLLAEAASGANPFEGCTPAQPDLVDLSSFGSAYDTAKTFKINGAATAGDVNGFHHMAVLRNGPEATTVRLGLKNPGGQTANADVTIRRGSRWVQVLITSAIVDTWGIKRASNEAATAITAGIRATSNDASGNRFLLAIPVGTTNDLVTGGVRLTTAATRARPCNRSTSRRRWLG